MNVNECRSGDIIGHVRSSRAYVYDGVVMCKVGGEWVEMHMYSTYFGEPEIFCRFENNFDGFEFISRN